MKLNSLFTPLLLMIFASAAFQTQAATDQAAATGSKHHKLVILVRHAQKLTHEGADPDLSAAGQRQANALKDRLEAMPLSVLIASQFKRTIQTLTPIATTRGMEIDIVPADRELEAHIAAIVKRVNDAQGNVLIAGHSNTVPLIIQALGGPKVAAIGEEEYGGLYLLSLSQDSPPSLILRHYGDGSGTNHSKDDSN